MADGYRDLSPSGTWLWERVVEAPHVTANRKKEEPAGNQGLGCNLQRSFPSDLLPSGRLHLPKAPQPTNTDGRMFSAHSTLSTGREGAGPWGMF